MRAVRAVEVTPRVAAAAKIHPIDQKRAGWMTRPRIVGFVAAMSAAGVLVAPVAADAAGLTRTRARAAAVVTARQLCEAVAWCVRSRVEPARACARRSASTVACDISFRAASGRSAAGLTVVRRAAGGKLEIGVAVPEEPAA